MKCLPGSKKIKKWQNNVNVHVQQIEMHCSGHKEFFRNSTVKHSVLYSVLADTQYAPESVRIGAGANVCFVRAADLLQSGEAVTSKVAQSHY